MLKIENTIAHRPVVHLLEEGPVLQIPDLHYRGNTY